MNAGAGDPAACQTLTGREIAAAKYRPWHAAAIATSQRSRPASPGLGRASHGAGPDGRALPITRPRRCAAAKRFARNALFAAAAAPCPCAVDEPPHLPIRCPLAASFLLPVLSSPHTHGIPSASLQSARTQTRAASNSRGWCRVRQPLRDGL